MPEPDDLTLERPDLTAEPGTVLEEEQLAARDAYVKKTMGGDTSPLTEEEIKNAQIEAGKRGSEAPAEEFASAEQLLGQAEEQTDIPYASDLAAATAGRVEPVTSAVQPVQEAATIKPTMAEAASKEGFLRKKEGEKKLQSEVARRIEKAEITQEREKQSVLAGRLISVQENLATTNRMRQWLYGTNQQRAADTATELVTKEAAGYFKRNEIAPEQFVKDMIDSGSLKGDPYLSYNSRDVARFEAELQKPENKRRSIIGLKQYDKDKRNFASKVTSELYSAKSREYEDLQFKQKRAELDATLALTEERKANLNKAEYLKRKDQIRAAAANLTRQAEASKALKPELANSELFRLVTEDGAGAGEDKLRALAATMSPEEREMFVATGKANMEKFFQSRRAYVESLQAPATTAAAGTASARDTKVIRETVQNAPPNASDKDKFDMARAALGLAQEGESPNPAIESAITDEILKTDDPKLAMKASMEEKEAKAQTELETKQTAMVKEIKTALVAGRTDDIFRILSTNDGTFTANDVVATPPEGLPNYIARRMAEVIGEKDPAAGALFMQLFGKKDPATTGLVNNVANALTQRRTEKDFQDAAKNWDVNMEFWRKERLPPNKILTTQLDKGQISVWAGEKIQQPSGKQAVTATVDTNAAANAELWRKGMEGKLKQAEENGQLDILKNELGLYGSGMYGKKIRTQADRDRILAMDFSKPPDYDQQLVFKGEAAQAANLNVWHTGDPASREMQKVATSADSNWNSILQEQAMREVAAARPKGAPVDPVKDAQAAQQYVEERFGKASVFANLGNETSSISMSAESHKKPEEQVTFAEKLNKELDNIENESFRSLQPNRASGLKRFAVQHLTLRGKAEEIKIGKLIRDKLDPASNTKNNNLAVMFATGNKEAMQFAYLQARREVAKDARSTMYSDKPGQPPGLYQTVQRSNQVPPRLREDGFETTNLVDMLKELPAVLDGLPPGAKQVQVLNDVQQALEDYAEATKLARYGLEKNRLILKAVGESEQYDQNASTNEAKKVQAQQAIKDSNLLIDGKHYVDAMLQAYKNRASGTVSYEAARGTATGAVPTGEEQELQAHRRETARATLPQEERRLASAYGDVYGSRQGLKLFLEGARGLTGETATAAMRYQGKTFAQQQLERLEAERRNRENA
jgi:hypothetical protein